MAKLTDRQRLAKLEFLARKQAKEIETFRQVLNNNANYLKITAVATNLLAKKAGLTDAEIITALKEESAKDVIGNPPRPEAAGANPNDSGDGRPEVLSTASTGVGTVQLDKPEQDKSGDGNHAPDGGDDSNTDAENPEVQTG